MSSCKNKIGFARNFHSGIDEESAMGVSGLDEIINQNDETENSQGCLDVVKNESISISRQSERAAGSRPSILKLIHQKSSNSKLRETRNKSQHSQHTPSKFLKTPDKRSRLIYMSFNFAPEEDSKHHEPPKESEHVGLTKLGVTPEAFELPPSATFLEFEAVDKDELDDNTLIRAPLTFRHNHNDIKSVGRSSPEL